jgi:hypothetical protein
VAYSTQVDEDSDGLESFARAELDRAARGLAAPREPVRGEVVDGALAALVIARDAQFWAAIDAGGSAHE